jgi:hypothetical protein
MFIPDPDPASESYFFYSYRIPDPGVKKAPDPVPDPQHCLTVPFFRRLLWWVYPKLPQARLDLLLKVLSRLQQTTYGNAAVIDFRRRKKNCKILLFLFLMYHGNVTDADIGNTSLSWHKFRLVD